MPLREIESTPRKKGCGCGGSSAAAPSRSASRSNASERQALQVVDFGGSIEESCRRFGELLGLSRPVPVAAFEAAANNPTYLHELMAARSAPPFLQRLIERPPAPEKTAKRPSTATLLKRASKALMHWGASGFATVDEATLARRLDACLRCPNLVDPPKSMAYTVATAGNSSAVTGSKICSRCGCVVAKKARMASESCPLDLWDRP